MVASYKSRNLEQDIFVFISIATVFGVLILYPTAQMEGIIGRYFLDVIAINRSKIL